MWKYSKFWKIGIGLSCISFGSSLCLRRFCANQHPLHLLSCLKNKGFSCRSCIGNLVWPNSRSWILLFVPHACWNTWKSTIKYYHLYWYHSEARDHTLHQILLLTLTNYQTQISIQTQVFCPQGLSIYKTTMAASALFYPFIRISSIWNLSSHRQCYALLLTFWCWLDMKLSSLLVRSKNWYYYSSFFQDLKYIFHQNGSRQFYLLLLHLSCSHW